MSSSLLYSLAIVAGGLIAGLAPLFHRWSHLSAHRWIAFGAGSLLGAAFLHLIPEGFELAGVSEGLPFMALGFLLLYAIEQFSLKHPHEEDAGEFHEVGILAFIGLTLHDLVDGITLGSGEHLPEISPAIFMSVLLHKIPMTFSLAVLLVHGGYRRSRVMMLIGIMLAAIPAGVLLSSLVMAYDPSAVTVGRLVLFSAGTFVYIGAYELLPEMHRKSASDRLVGLFFILGIATMFVLRLIQPEH